MSKGTSLERVVAGVIRLNGQMLLCHRRPDRTFWPNVWDLPGGHIVDNESTAAALVRELAEELGVKVDPPTGPPWMTLRAGSVELNLYLIGRRHGEPRNVALEEHDDIRWFTVDDVRFLDLADPAYIEILRQASTAAG